MNSEQIFQIALGLESPWYVSKVELVIDSGKKELHLSIAYEQGFYIDGSKKSQVYDHKSKSWRHLNFFEHECYLHCDVPRVVDSKGEVHQVEVPWSRKGSGFTLMFEAYSMLLIELEMPVNKVGRLLKEYPNRIWTIFNYWMGISYGAADHSNISKLGIDETSSKKGHEYITVAVDMETSRVVHATQGKGAESITKIADYLATKGSPRDKVEQICIDLSPSFISGVKKEFPFGAIIFDRFHVKALLNKAMDKVRKEELAKHQSLKHLKYAFLKDDKNMSSAMKSQRNELLNLLPRLAEAYRLKLLFDDFWSMEPDEAQGFLAFWCDFAIEAQLAPFVEFVNTVLNHWQGIINYSTFKLSNGILEGTNSKIQLAKKRARGFRNINNFINMIYLIAGQLKFNYPHTST